MNLLRLVDGTPTPITKRQIRERFPNVSFPQAFPVGTLRRFGVFPYTVAPQPEINPNTQRVSLGAIQETPSGDFVQEWVVENIPQSEINDRKDQEALDSVDQLAFKLIFTQENRLRVLEGKPKITKAQFIQFIKGQL